MNPDQLLDTYEVLKERDPAWSHLRERLKVADDNLATARGLLVEVHRNITNEWLTTDDATDDDWLARRDAFLKGAGE